VLCDCGWMFADCQHMALWSRLYCLICFKLHDHTQFVHECDQVRSKRLYWNYFKLCDIMIACVGRPGETSDKRFLSLWTKAAMMLDWGSSTLDITTAGIVGVYIAGVVLGVALWGCWQCLLTVGGNLLHTL
jgi:hypothetical protein